jgi:hypothetical protein
MSQSIYQKYKSLSLHVNLWINLHDPWPDAWVELTLHVSTMLFVYNKSFGQNYKQGILKYFKNIFYMYLTSKVLNNFYSRVLCVCVRVCVKCV